MKRLQFRHHTDLFQSRSEALEFFKNITDSSHDASALFGTSLYAEPMIAKYQDENGVTQVLVAIGVESGNTPYHIIDSALLAELIENNRKDILSEQTRAIAAEASLSGSIETEIAKAIANEASLSGSINTERLERVESDEKLQQQISDNIASVIQVTENLGSNVREEYVLKNAKGEELGSHIKVYKDSALVGAEVNFKGATGVTINEEGKFIFSYDVDMDKEIEYLYLVYRNENGGLSLVALDFENFLMENEEGFGIKIIDHRITINIKSDEKYLKVTENGLQTENIDETINGAIKSVSDELNAKIDTEIKTNKITSKDLVVNKTDEGTTLTIQTDEVTITKMANAETIYDTNIAVLGTLLQVKKVEPLSTNIKSRYELQGADGKLIGDPIELTVESALIDVKQGKVGDSIDPETGNYVSEGDGDTTMNFVYRLENGTYELVQIVVSEYFTDSHFGKGLNNQDGVVSLVEGDGNEYLVIGEDTIAVIGVKADINSAITIAKEYSNNLKLDINSVSDKVDLLIGEDSDKNIRTIAKEEAAIEVAKFVANDFNSLSGVVSDVVYGEGNNSINHRINDKFNTSLITAGLPATEVNIEEAQKHSLLREVSVNGEIKYYVSNSSDEIICKMPDGTTKALTDYIKELNEKIVMLESSINNSTIDIESKIVEILKNTIKGTPNEIAVNSDDSSIVIGFDENAIFGEY